MVEKNACCSICDVLVDQVIIDILNEYPDECQSDVKRLLHSFDLENCNLVRVRSNIYDLPIENLYEMMNR